MDGNTIQAQLSTRSETAKAGWTIERESGAPGPKRPNIVVHEKSSCHDGLHQDQLLRTQVMRVADHTATQVVQ